MKSYLMYKNQTRGVEDVLETVKTAEKIAASSVHFLKQEVADLNSYAAELEKVLARLSLFYRNKNHPLLQKREVGRKMILILTGNKGLVGGLWHELIGTFLENAEQYQAVMVVGAKGENYLKEESIPIITLPANFVDIPKKEEVARITGYIFNEFRKGAFSQVAVLYPSFVSLAEQVPSCVPFLPFEFELSEKKDSGEGLPICEPSKQKVFDSLLQKYIEVFLYRIIMETKLSELSARTVAMEHAAAKTEELIRKLTLGYAKERRRVVTQRQLESFTAHRTCRPAGKMI